MGTIAQVDDWEGDPEGGSAYRYIRIGSATNPGAKRGKGYIYAWESTPGYGGYADPFLTVSVTHSIPDADRGKGIGMGMYLAGLKYAKDNNLGFRSDSSVSSDASKVWGALRSRGVKMTRDYSGYKYSISAADVQAANIADLNRQRRTTG